MKKEKTHYYFDKKLYAEHYGIPVSECPSWVDYCNGREAVFKGNQPIGNIPSVMYKTSKIFCREVVK